MNGLFNFRKHSRLIMTIAVIVAVAIISGCEANRIDSGDPSEDIVEYDSHNIRIGMYEMIFELPNGYSVNDCIPNSDNFFASNYNSDLISPDLQYTYIIKNDIVVGAFTLADLGGVPEEQFDYFKENPGQNYRAVYSYLPMGSVVTRGIDYKTVYESEDLREGSATDLKYYRSDYFGDIPIDFSQFKEEIDEGETRINYYNKGILGYNINVNKFAAMELYYDAITDEEWQHIAETLRIMEIVGGYNSGIQFNISIQPEQYNENPFDGSIVNEILRSKGELETYCQDEVYAYTTTDGLGQEMMYLRPLIVTYDDEYFKDKALVAVTFEYEKPANIYGITIEGNILTAWVYQFLEISDTPEASTARVFLVEVDKEDVEGVTAVYPGIDGAPMIILPSPEPVEEYKYIYINSEIGFPVSIPASWTGKYIIEYQENGFTVYHRATYDVNPGMGMMFRVQKRDGAVPNELIAENPGGAAYFSGDDYYIAFIVPTDVQYSDGTSEEYIELSGQIDEIRRGIAVAMKESVTSVRAELTSDPSVQHNPVFEHTEYKNFKNEGESYRDVKITGKLSADSEEISVVISLPDCFFINTSIIDYDGRFDGGFAKGLKAGEFVFLEQQTENNIGEDRFAITHEGVEVFKDYKKKYENSAENKLGVYTENEKILRVINFRPQSSADNNVLQYLVRIEDKYFFYIMFYISKNASSKDLELYDEIVFSIVL